MSFAEFKYQYTVSPIILKGGIAQSLPGGMMSMVNLTQSAAYASGVTGQGDVSFYNDFFAQYDVVPGGTLIDNQLGSYPFANQQVAANAIIESPLRVSVVMICPARNDAGFQQKQAIITSLTNSLKQHTRAGGLFAVFTPAFVYNDCILLQMRDGGGESKQPQESFVLDFVQPLVTLAAAREAQNSLMKKFSSGVRVDGDPPAYSGVPDGGSPTP